MVFNCDVSQAHSLFELFLSLWSAPFSSLHPADHFSWKLFSRSLLHSVLRCLFLSYDSKTRCTILCSPDWVYTLIWHRLPVCEGWMSLCMHSILEKKQQQQQSTPLISTMGMKMTLICMWVETSNHIVRVKGWASELALKNRNSKLSYWIHLEILQRIERRRHVCCSCQVHILSANF